MSTRWGKVSAVGLVSLLVTGCSPAEPAKPSASPTVQAASDRSIALTCDEVGGHEVTFFTVVTEAGYDAGGLGTAANTAAMRAELAKRAPALTSKLRVTSEGTKDKQLTAAIKSYADELESSLGVDVSGLDGEGLLRLMSKPLATRDVVVAACSKVQAGNDSLVCADLRKERFKIEYVDAISRRILLGNLTAAETKILTAQLNDSYLRYAQTVDTLSQQAANDKLKGALAILAEEYRRSSTENADATFTEAEAAEADRTLFNFCGYS